MCSKVQLMIFYTMLTMVLIIIQHCLQCRVNIYSVQMTLIKLVLYLRACNIGKIKRSKPSGTIFIKLMYVYYAYSYPLGAIVNMFYEIRLRQYNLHVYYYTIYDMRTYIFSSYTVYTAHEHSL